MINIFLFVGLKVFFMLFPIIQNTFRTIFLVYCFNEDHYMISLPIRKCRGSRKYIYAYFYHRLFIFTYVFDPLCSSAGCVEVLFGSRAANPIVATYSGNVCFWIPLATRAAIIWQRLDGLGNQGRVVGGGCCHFALTLALQTSSVLKANKSTETYLGLTCECTNMSNALWPTTLNGISGMRNETTVK